MTPQPICINTSKEHTESGLPNWDPPMLTPCINSLATMSSTECTAPPNCILEAHTSPGAVADPDSQPQYTCQLMYSGGWQKNVPSPTGGPTSRCAALFATGGNLSPGNWNECVKYGNAWHITGPGIDNKRDCYGRTGISEHGHRKELCLNKDHCPLYVQTEADKKCVRYPTKRACMNTLQANHPQWNDPTTDRQAIIDSIIISDSGHEALTPFTSSDSGILNVVLILVFIAFAALGYALLKDVEKYRKGKTSAGRPFKETNNYI